MNTISGIATLVNGSVVINNTAINQNSDIRICKLIDSEIPCALSVSNIQDGVSFTILSTNPTDCRNIAWHNKS